MSIEISRVHSLMAQALNYRSRRQNLIASNIANQDTPFYKARDISFKDVLIANKNKIFTKNDNKLKLATTQDKHLDITIAPKSNIYKASIIFNGGATGNDGNDVNIDKETTELSKNSIAYNALIAAIKKDAMIYSSVINASAKLS